MGGGSDPMYRSVVSAAASLALLSGLVSLTAAQAQGPEHRERQGVPGGAPSGPRTSPQVNRGTEPSGPRRETAPPRISAPERPTPRTSQGAQDRGSRNAEQSRAVEQRRAAERRQAIEQRHAAEQQRVRERDQATQQ